MRLPTPKPVCAGGNPRFSLSLLWSALLICAVALATANPCAGQEGVIRMDVSAAAGDSVDPGLAGLWAVAVVDSEALGLPQGPYQALQYSGRLVLTGLPQGLPLKVMFLDDQGAVLNVARMRLGMGEGTLQVAVRLPDEGEGEPSGRWGMADQGAVSYRLGLGRSVYLSADTLRTTYQLQNFGQSSVGYTYPTTQRYDLAIYEEQREVWRWSQGRVFAEVAATETLAAGERLVYPVTVPLAGLGLGTGSTCELRATPSGALADGRTPPEVRITFRIGNARSTLVTVRAGEPVRVTGLFGEPARIQIVSFVTPLEGLVELYRLRENPGAVVVGHHYLQAVEILPGVAFQGVADSVRLELPVSAGQLDSLDVQPSRVRVFYSGPGSETWADATEQVDPSGSWVQGVAGDFGSFGLFVESDGLAGDFDGDGAVDFRDYLTFAVGYGREPSDPAYNPALDLNGDGPVDFEDFLVFAANFER